MIDPASSPSSQLIGDGNALPVEKTSHLWHQRIKHLQWVELNFSAQAENSFQVVAQKGGLLHDAFGRVLEQVDNEAFKQLWQPSFDTESYTQFGVSSPPKAFTLNPPRDRKTDYQYGEKFTIKLVLFGHASHYVQPCIKTMSNIGKSGLGSVRAKFKLSACGGSKRPIKAKIINKASDQLLDVVVTLNSPTYFKCKGQRIFKAPQFTYLLARIIYRANWLSVCSGRGLLISDALRKEMLDQASSVTIKQDDTAKQAWRRYSVSRKKWMYFDGIAGAIHYSGVAAELIPLFELASAINIGGKTSFGMGEVQWRAA